METTQRSENETLEKLEDQLEIWRNELIQVLAKTKATGKKAASKSREQLDELKDKIDAAQSKLDEAKLAGEDKWDTLKGDVMHIWQELEGSFKRLIH